MAETMSSLDAAEGKWANKNGKALGFPIYCGYGSCFSCALFLVVKGQQKLKLIYCLL